MSKKSNSSGIKKVRISVKTIYKFAEKIVEITKKCNQKNKVVVQAFFCGILVQCKKGETWETVVSHYKDLKENDYYTED